MVFKEPQTSNRKNSTAVSTVQPEEAALRCYYTIYCRNKKVTQINF